MKTLVGMYLLALVAGAGVVQARDDTPSANVTGEQLLAEDLASDPGKQAVSHVYSFPAAAVLPWHIHPDAYEVVYVLEGDFTMEVAGEGQKTYTAGESFYLAPNRVHRGLNKGSAPARIFVVRVKPKDKPLTQEVPPPG